MKKLLLFFLVAICCCGLFACGSKAKDKAYPIGIDGTEVIVGETTLGVLFDAGFTIRETGAGSSDGMDPNQMLDANSYFTGIYVDKGDTKYCSLEIVTDKKSIPLKEAVIAKVKVNTSLSQDAEGVTFDGIKLSEMTPDIAQEHIEGANRREDNTRVYLSGTNYFVGIDFESNSFTELEMKRVYNVKY